MMILLARNVSLYARHSGLAYGEATIALLPSEVLMLDQSLVNPFGGTAFYLLEHFGVRQVGAIANQQVNVVGHAVDCQKRATEVAKDAADEWVEALFPVWGDQVRAVLGAEDGMVVILGVGGGHGSGSSA